MFSRRDLPLDGSALLDDVIVSELAARRPAPITDPAVGLLAALVAAVDSRPIPDSQGSYDWVLDLHMAERPPAPAARSAELSRLPARSAARPASTPTIPIVIHRTWDGPRHRRNRPARRRVTSSLAVLSVVATTVGVSGVAAAVGTDPLRPFHSVVTRVWHGVAGSSRAPDARQGVGQSSQVGSATPVSAKHREASTAAIAAHLHPVLTTRTPYLWPDPPSQGLTAIGPYSPGSTSYRTPPGSPVHSSGGSHLVGPVTGSGGSNEPGQLSGPVWAPPESPPSGGIAESHPKLLQPQALTQ